MMTYQELIELARLRPYNSRIATDREVAHLLWHMAKEYQAKAAKVHDGLSINRQDEFAIAP
jgi:hypothetical protein